MHKTIKKGAPVFETQQKGYEMQRCQLFNSTSYEGDLPIQLNLKRENI